MSSHRPDGLPAQPSTPPGDGGSPPASPQSPRSPPASPRLAHSVASRHSARSNRNGPRRIVLLEQELQAAYASRATLIDNRSRLNATVNQLTADLRRLERYHWAQDEDMRRLHAENDDLQQGSSITGSSSTSLIRSARDAAQALVVSLEAETQRTRGQLGQSQDDLDAALTEETRLRSVTTAVRRSAERAQQARDSEIADLRSQLDDALREVRLADAHFADVQQAYGVLRRAQEHSEEALEDVSEMLIRVLGWVDRRRTEFRREKSPRPKKRGQKRSVSPAPSQLPAKRVADTLPSSLPPSPSRSPTTGSAGGPSDSQPSPGGSPAGRSATDRQEVIEIDDDGDEIGNDGDRAEDGGANGGCRAGGVWSRVRVTLYRRDGPGGVGRSGPLSI
ncbi:hypothetical protein ON010_g3711 [Phytophthora cinnamomi]|nr:hypothetical protein ON010_g3711 [Phytophthora cinnamomi]